ncbi:acyltransferase [Mycobacterium sp. DSM 3803]|nr:acyltransferase [Mycobacterium sp. DSM 3803]
MQLIQSGPVLTTSADARVRDDLIGLAGIATILVVVCHVWFGRVSAAIDVLLVLAGFVLGSRVIGSVGNFRALGADAAWLVRRSLPALVLTLGAGAVLTVSVQPQTRWEAFADHTLATLGFWQNWQLLWTASDYVQASETVTPLQHLWVVSLLGQIFVGFLMLTAVVTMVARGDSGSARTVLLWATGVAMAASFGYAVTVHSSNHLLAYYSSVARAWEVLAGVLAAAIVARLDFPRWARAFVTALGLIAIVVCGTVVDGVAEDAWPWVVIPVAASVLIILCGAQRDSLPRTVDALRGVVFVAAGTIAYGMYLWHWPLLIFWLAHVNDDTVGVAEGGVVLLTAAVAAFATARLVDGPRESNHVRQLLSGSVIVVLAAALAVMSLGWQGHVALARASGAELSALSARDYPGAEALIEGRKVARLPTRPTALEAAEDMPPATIDGCVTDFPGVDVKTCVYGDPTAQRTIALAGGSHSEHWLTALHALGRQYRFKVTTYLKMGCPLTTKDVPLIAGSPDLYPQCRTWSDNALARIIADRPDYVFFTSTRPILTGPGDYVPDYYLGIWDELSANGIRMLGMRDTPWMLKQGWFFSPVDCLAAGGDADGCGLPRYEALAERNPTLDHLADYPLMTALDLSDAVCGPDMCRAVEGNVLVYHDAHHLSATYVRTLTRELGRQLRGATRWW